jgi:hypothetical protein
MLARDLTDRRDRAYAERMDGKPKRPGLAVRQYEMKERLLKLPRRAPTCSYCGGKGHTRDCHVEGFSGIVRWYKSGAPGWCATTDTKVEPPERRGYGVCTDPVVLRARKPASIEAFQQACLADFRGEYVKPHFRQLFAIRKLMQKKTDGSWYSGPEIARRLKLTYPTFRRRLLELQTLTQGIL